MDDIDRLNSEVTGAIFDSEREPTPENYARVSCIEEELTRLTKPNTIEGVVCRTGAVRAALRAGEMERAVELYESFMAEPGALADLKWTLTELMRTGEFPRRETLCKE